MSRHTQTTSPRYPTPAALTLREIQAARARVAAHFPGCPALWGSTCLCAEQSRLLTSQEGAAAAVVEAREGRR